MYVFIGDEPKGKGQGWDSYRLQSNNATSANEAGLFTADLVGDVPASLVKRFFAPVEKHHVGGKNAFGRVALKDFYDRDEILAACGLVDGVEGDPAIVKAYQRAVKTANTRAANAAKKAALQKEIAAKFSAEREALAKAKVRLHHAKLRLAIASGAAAELARKQINDQQVIIRDLVAKLAAAKI